MGIDAPICGQKRRQYRLSSAGKPTRRSIFTVAVRILVGHSIRFTLQEIRRDRAPMHPVGRAPIGRARLNTFVDHLNGVTNRELLLAVYRPGPVFTFKSAMAGAGTSVDVLRFTATAINPLLLRSAWVPPRKKQSISFSRPISQSVQFARPYSLVTRFP